METFDLSDIIGKPVTHLHVGQYGTYIEVEGGTELHVEPVLKNKDEKVGNAYATLAVRIVP